MAVSAEDKRILAAYSTGRTGWRDACRRLNLLHIDELHDALEEAGLPPPAPAPADTQAAARLQAFLRGEKA